MKTLTAFLAALLLTLASSGQTVQPTAPPEGQAAPSASEAITLDLRRPWVRGDSYSLTLDQATHAEGGSGQDVQFWSPQSHDEQITFSGKVRVIDVNAAGEGTALLVHLEKVSVKGKGTSEVMKIEGADLGVSFPLGKSQFVRKDGQAIPPDEVAILKQIFRPPTGVNQAEYVSPDRPVKPGDSWPVKRETLAKALLGQGTAGTAAPEITDGTVTFAGFEPLDGIACVHLTVRWAFKTGDKDRFIGTTVTEFREDLLVPRDPASKASRTVTELTGRVNGRVRNAENQLLEVKSLTRTTRKVEIK